MELRIKEQGVMISLWLNDPNGEKGSIVLAPGLPQYIDKYHPLVKQAERLGLNLFVIKYRGSHESDGYFSLKESIKTIEISLKLINKGEARDLYANQEIRWDTKNIILLGFSYGALPSVLQKGKIEKRILICPFIFPQFHVGKKCIGENIAKTLDFLEEAYKNIYRIDSKKFLTELASLKIFPKKERMTIVFGKDDKSIPFKEVEKIEKYYKNSDIILKEGGHSIIINDEIMAKICNIEKKYYSINDFINFTKVIAKHELDKLSSGNFSLRLSENTFVIKPTGLAYNKLTLENISIVDFEGRCLSGLKPSSDLKIHLSIYKSREDINCIIHTHSHYATVMSALSEPLYAVSTLQADYFGGNIPCLKYINHRKYNIAENVLKSKKESFLLEKHGTLLIGKVPENVINKAIILEEVAKLNYNLKLIKKIKALKNQDIKILNKYYREEYGN